MDNAVLQNLSSRQLDDIAREGLEALRASLRPDADPATFKTADQTLKILRQGTSRISGENNKNVVLLKAGKAAEVPPAEMRMFWDHLVSGEPWAPRRRTRKQE
jgi:hypothetical protein